MSSTSPAKPAASPVTVSPKLRENVNAVGPASQLIIKDVGEIHSRLLDHRPIIHGETRYFIKEFEEKRGYRELRVLENVKNSISEMSDPVLPKCIDTMQDQLGLALKTLETANHTTRRLQQGEQEHAKSTAEKAGNEKLRTEWEVFLKEQEQRRLAVDDEQRKAVQRLREQYAEMKRELTKMASFQ
ncbi:PREDICTED: biogenesis of lysosome-related organelles complex 1 subunit 5 [Nanorana parkeri]|uniref:biogenesis of lysosome-related organelles complex 1 subunit 5 n=1 Tax=Nanorana parkeri TaxID=125878 RepID=UPI000854FF7C|nr:PREDICTED: biogenesis of lysosome-related organelles complex 1 subunit 5 [Nanorana parkeri]